MAAGSKLQTLVEQAIGIELEKPLERQRQLAVFNTLNSTELAVLRCIASCPEAQGTAVADAIENRVCTTKAYTGMCIQHLTTLEVTWAGKTMPLLQARMETNGKLDDTCMFWVGACIDREMLASASGRPFNLAETAVLKPAARAKWFTNYLLEADDEQRWPRFNEVLDHMPRTFLTDFVKSEEGQTFLRGFSGSDAMFVRLTVEELPGCKRLAAKLWPEVPEEKDGEE